MANKDASPAAVTQFTYLEPEPVDNQAAVRRKPPPLPPRKPTQDGTSSSTFNPSLLDLMPQEYRGNDTRWSSMQSLVPTESPQDGKRVLLLIYIHGFMGNEASFQSFPWHVHQLLTTTMNETHVVHTKIYPRYKSRKAIEFARDEFSDWIQPHENSLTDIVLLGHSMGGILAAEVALIPSQEPGSGQGLRHRILGTVNFDTPFLGMHPGLVISGISSLFRSTPVQATPPQPSQAETSASTGTTSPSPDSPESSAQDSAGTFEDLSSNISRTTSGESSLSSLRTKDPYYDQPFPNDVNRPQRTGFNKFFHFVSKHSDALTTATKQYFLSHIEFGSCLADFPGLRSRYNRLRALEDVDELSNNARQEQRNAVRVRFLNYYTASTGIPKKPKTQSKEEVEGEDPEAVEKLDEMTLNSPSDATTDLASHDVTQTKTDENNTPKAENLEEESPIKVQLQNLGEASGVKDDEDEDTLPAMRHIDSIPINDESDDHQGEMLEDDESFYSLDSKSDEEQSSSPQTSLSSNPLPSIPPEPIQPDPVDLSVYTDKDEKKIAEKEYKRVLKAYQQAVKDRENAIKDRRKLIEKREKKARQDEEKRLKEEKKQLEKELKEEEKKIKATETPSAEESKSTPKKEKPKREKRFCLLPGDISGKKDQCWVKVYMEGVDEVGAHCGLFFPGPQYETLVGDVADRIEEWARDDATKRAVLQAQEQG